MSVQDPKQDLLPYMTFPIADLNTVPKPGTLSKEERLRTIIANLDHHHQATRLKIIEAGKQNLAEAQAIEAEKHAKTTHFNTTSEDRDMDLPDPPLPEDPSSLSLLLKNLATPYNDSMGDPVCTTPIPPNPPDINQSPPPLAIHHAKQTLDKIALYDSIALPSRKFYSDALDRLTGPPPAPTSDPRRNSTDGHGGGGGSGFAKPSPREPNSRPGSSSRGASTATATSLFGQPSPRDPRLVSRDRNGSGISARQSPLQSPVERTTDPRLRR